MIKEEKEQKLVDQLQLTP